jgi:hypothetical protein
LTSLRAAHQRLELKSECEPQIRSPSHAAQRGHPDAPARRGPRRRRACSDRERPDALGRRPAHQDPERRRDPHGGRPRVGAPDPREPAPLHPGRPEDPRRVEYVTEANGRRRFLTRRDPAHPGSFLPTAAGRAHYHHQVRWTVLVPRSPRAVRPARALPVVAPGAVATRRS